jgi:hypothetical protein
MAQIAFCIKKISYRKFSICQFYTGSTSFKRYNFDTIIIIIDFAISKTDSIKTDTSTGHIYNLDHACILGFCSFIGTIIIKKKSQ